MTEAPNVDELAHQFSDRFVGQPEWIVYAWGVLATAGVVPPDVDEMHSNLTDHLVTVAALAYLAEVINNEGAAQVPDITEGVFPVADIDLGRYAERQGVYKGSADDLRDRFIHFSTAAQVAETVRKHYFGQTGLFLIAVDVDMLGDALRWERSRNDELFPHLYGELDIGAVTAILDLRARSDGYHDIPELTP